MRNTWPRWTLLGVILWHVGCAGCPSTPAPPAQTPVLESVFQAGTSPTNVGIDPAGAFEVLPSSSVIVWFRSPITQSVEVAVNGVVLEQTSDMARQQVLGSQGLGYWSHRSGSPNVNVSGDPRWDVAITAAPALRFSTGFTITLTGTTSNATTPRSMPPLSVPIALGIPDWVSIPFNPANDNAVVLLDGQRASGCVDDELWRGNDIINVDDVRAAGNCNEELIVFTKSNAVQVVKRGAGLWTDSLRDLVAANADAGMWNVPVEVWLLQSGLMSSATSDFARADMVYDASRCGISFTPNFHDVSTTNAPVIFGSGDIGTMQSQTWRNGIKASAFFTVGKIKVYYAGIAFTNPSVTGFTAVPDDPDIIGIGLGETNETLAHELGHSFTLKHSDGVSGIPPTNIMNAGGMVMRTEFTKGQCFRMTVNNTSTLNTTGVRSGWIRHCEDGDTNSTCPALSFDVP